MPTLAFAGVGGAEQIIDDPNDYFTPEERAAIIKSVQELPESYHYLIMPSTTADFDIKADANKIFSDRGFSQDTIFFLIYSGSRQIHITTGDSLKQKKLDDQFFTNEIEKYFIPFVSNGGTVADALVQLTKGISVDIPARLVSGKEEITNPEPPTLPDPVVLKDEVGGVNTWVVITAIVALLLVLALITIIMINRARSHES
jgi:hypothetical protein